MGFVMPHMMVLIGIGVIGVALLFEIIGLATTGWIVVSDDHKTGLWESCSPLFRGCISIDSSTSWLDACRAFGILAVLAMAASLGAALLIGFMSEQKIFTLLAPAAAAIGAFCAMIEFAVYVGKYNDEGGDMKYLGYSFALTVVAFVLSIAAAALFFVGRTRSA